MKKLSLFFLTLVLCASMGMHGAEQPSRAQRALEEAQHQLEMRCPSPKSHLKMFFPKKGWWVYASKLFEHEGNQEMAQQVLEESEEVHAQLNDRGKDRWESKMDLSIAVRAHERMLSLKKTDKPKSAFGAMFGFVDLVKRDFRVAEKYYKDAGSLDGVDKLREDFARIAHDHNQQLVSQSQRQ